MSKILISLTRNQNNPGASFVNVFFYVEIHLAILSTIMTPKLTIHVEKTFLRKKGNTNKKASKFCWSPVKDIKNSKTF